MGNIHKGPWLGADICKALGIHLEDWAKLTPNMRALFRMAYAADICHIVEEPVGSNTGPEVTRVLDLVGVGAPNPWCAAIYTAYLLDSGARRNHLPLHAASVHGWGEWAHAHSYELKVPERGCIGLIYHTATTGHLCVVNEVNLSLGQVHTIEGNTNIEGGREGYGVFRHIRRLIEFAVFVNCDHL